MCFPCPLMLPNSRRQVDLIMPQYWYDLVRKKLPIADETSAQFRPQFHRVVMTVGQILEAPFFKEYIKIGAVARRGCRKRRTDTLGQATFSCCPRATQGQDNVFTPARRVGSRCAARCVGNSNTTLISRRRPGKLTMFLDRETYERAGLVGKPHGAKGKRGLKPRWSAYLTSPAGA